jgi:hypothetical protein
MDSRAEDFEWWITTIPDRIEELQRSLPADIAAKLDRSLGSLDSLEAYLLANYTIERMKAAENASLYDGLARYVGSTFNRNIPNLEWYIELEEESDIYFNVPVLVLKDGNLPPTCPLTLITAALDRRTGNYMSGVAEAYRLG